jgi:hypothetical protein
MKPNREPARVHRRPAGMKRPHVVLCPGSLPPSLANPHGSFGSACSAVVQMAHYSHDEDAQSEEGGSPGSDGGEQVDAADVSGRGLSPFWCMPGP